MSEGGMLAWKHQRIRQPKNGRLSHTNYTDISKPLPDPPKGMIWVQEETREWKLMSVTTATSNVDDEVALAQPTTHADGDGACVGDDNNNAVTAIPVAEVEASLNNNTPTIIDNGIQYHEVLPTDTFQGLCLRYKLTPTELRQANRMLSNNLKLAPSYPKLLIPSNNKNEKKSKSSNSSTTQEEKIISLISKVQLRTKNKLSYSEARAYLDMCSWNVNEAMDSVKDDVAWSYFASESNATQLSFSESNNNNNAVVMKKKKSFHDEVGSMDIESKKIS